MTNWSSTRTSTGTGSTVELDDRQLYQCIRLHVFNSSKTVSFILPDDKFKLMRYVFLIGPAINDSTIDGYRLTSIVTLPLCFHHQNRHQPSTVYGCNEGNKPSAINAVLGIPTRPASTAKQPMGRPAENVVVWRPHRVHILGDGVSNEHDDADVDTQMWTFRCWWSLHRGWSCGSSRCLRTTRMSNGCDTRPRQREHTRSRWVYCYLLGECSQAQLWGSR